MFTSGQVRGYPALADAGSSVDIRLFDTEEAAAESMRLGTRRLLLLAVPSGVRSIAGRLPMTAKMAMSRHPYPGAAALLDDCAACAADQVIDDAGGPAWDADGFARLVEAARARLAPDTARVLDRVAQILAEAHDVELRLANATAGGPALAAALDDMRAQFAGLIYPGFIAQTGAARLRTSCGTCGPSAGDWTSSARSTAGMPSGWQRCTGSRPSTRRRGGNCRLLTARVLTSRRSGG